MPAYSDSRVASSRREKMPERWLIGTYSSGALVLMRDGSSPELRVALCIDACAADFESADLSRQK